MFVYEIDAMFVILQRENLPICERNGARANDDMGIVHTKRIMMVFPPYRILFPIFVYTCNGLCSRRTIYAHGSRCCWGAEKRRRCSSCTRLTYFTANGPRALGLRAFFFGEARLNFGWHSTVLHNNFSLYIHIYVPQKLHTLFSGGWNMLL